MNCKIKAEYTEERVHDGKRIRVTVVERELTLDEQLERIKEVLAELQAREKARDPAWRPRVDLREKVQVPKTE
ncbi:MAG: hypothetical protein AB1609_18785 [Bacillota bacterium]